MDDRKRVQALEAIPRIAQVNEALHRDVMTLISAVQALNSRLPRLQDYYDHSGPRDYEPSSNASDPVAVLRDASAARKRVDGALADIRKMTARVDAAVSGEWLTDEWQEALRQHQKDHQ